MRERLIHLEPALAAMAVDNKLVDSILLNETDWKIIRHELLKPIKDSHKLLKGDRYVTLSLLPIAVKAIKAAMIKIVGVKGDGEARNRGKNLANFHERWKPNEASQYLEGDVVTRGRGIWQVELRPLFAFASALNPRTKLLKAYSKEDCKNIWAGKK
jgi:hypothetical protein